MNIKQCPSHALTMAPEFSCQRCYERKVKCDKAQPRCSNCVKHDAVCTASDVSQKKKRKRESEQSPLPRPPAPVAALPPPDIADRIARYETLLKDLSSEIASLKNHANIDSHAPTNSRRAGERYSPQAEFREIQTMLDASGKESTATDPLVTDLTSDHDVIASYVSLRRSHQTLFAWLDRVFPPNDAEALLYGARDDTPVLQPTSTEATRMWDIYLRNFDPVSKLVHAPSIQRKLACASNALSTADHALLFAIYSAAIASLSAQECMTHFARSHEDMTAFVRDGAKYWLHKASLWKTQDFQVLQAYVIYLLSLHPHVDPRTIAAFTATADRIAKRLGLHCEPSAALDPVQAELRRRVWWELQILEARSCEKCGLGASVLFNDCAVALPSVVSDLSQRVTAQEITPSPDMILYLIRCETAKFLATTRNQQDSKHVGWTEFSTAQWSLSHKLSLIRDFEHRIQLQYIIHCRSGNVGDEFTKKMFELIVARMRLSAYVSEESLEARGGNMTKTNSSADPHTTRTQMLMLCLQIVETYGFLSLNDAYSGFRWAARTIMPFVGFVHLFRLLRHHTKGPLVDRIWASIESNAALFRGPPPRPGVKQASLFKYPLLKAWAARKAALPSNRQDDLPFVREFIDAVEDVGTRHDLDDTETRGTASSAANTWAPVDDLRGVDWEQWLQDFIFNEHSMDSTATTTPASALPMYRDGALSDFQQL